jgi:hypothetical protein
MSIMTSPPTARDTLLTPSAQTPKTPPVNDPKYEGILRPKYSPFAPPAQDPQNGRGVINDTPDAHTPNIMICPFGHI